ncbi:hypothetical protein JHN45_30925 [Streptomyces sp. MBT53]|nr:hypothetical protein [Streptomyces sp. MBT53]
MAANFTHEILGRDWMIQNVVAGIPAAEGLNAPPRSEWGSFFAQLGTIARQVHDVTGPHFGPVEAPWFSCWSEAVVTLFQNTAADLEDAGLDARDVRDVTAAAEKHRAVLDEATEPKLLSGDLWTIH